MSRTSLRNLGPTTAPTPSRSASNAASSSCNQPERVVGHARFAGCRSSRAGSTLKAGPLVQRLFSVFPEGWPGAGLLLLRGLTAIPLLQFVHGPATPALPFLVAVQFLTAICSGFLLIGLWTPVSGALLAVSELALCFLPATVLSMNIVLAAL